MSLDLYAEVEYSNGEVVTLQDLQNNQRFLAARLNDQVLGKLIGSAASADPEFESQQGADPSTIWAYALTVGGGNPKQGSANNKVKIGAGTLFQKIANSDGTEPKLLAFTFPGTDEVTIANGDPTNPRVDMIQMALSYVDGTPVTRSSVTPGVKASLNLATKTTDDNTQIQAKVAGFSGNNVSISFAKRTSGVGVTYSENGNAASVVYQDAFSTVGDVEAAITANSTLIEIKVSGTLATVLHDPQDSFTSTHLAGGADDLLTAPSLNTTRKVQCTLNVKSGAAAASPVYPTPDAGFVPIAAVVVGATYAGAAPLVYIDTAGAVAVLHDLRMPLNIRPFLVKNQDATSRDITVPMLMSTDVLSGAVGAHHTRGAGEWVLGPNTFPIYFPIPLIQGDIITSYQFTLQKNDTTNVVNTRMYTSDTVDTPLTPGHNSTIVAGAQPLGETSLNIAIGPGVNYIIKVTPGGTTTPTNDVLLALQIFYKRLGTDASIVLTCPVPRGRLIAVAASSAAGVHTANTTRLAMETDNVGFSYLADISAITETTGAVKRHEQKLGDITAAALFPAGPIVLGNGTHFPPIWGNGKRCYEEQMNLTAGAATPTRLSMRFEYGGANIVDVFDATFYIAEGL